MAGQAGWYRAPGEEGTLRYWNGSTWTDHRQPAPVPAEYEPPRVLAEEPDPMAEYERQFDTISPSTTPIPQYRPLAPLAPVPTQTTAPQFARVPTAPRSFAPQPSPPAPNSLGPIALGPAVSAAIVLPAAAPAAPVAAVSPNHKAVLTAARAMGVAILVILIGVSAMALFSAQNLAGTGEVKTIGIVTSFGSTTGNSCTPIARFAVKGTSFTASSNTAISPCPVGLGQDVDVIYSAADPASAARIQLGPSLAQYLWLLPAAGVLFFLASLTAFVVRAGSILAGIALIRDGRKRSKARAAGE
jgi:hypothetical protein